MTTLQDAAKLIAVLDAKRTQGNWSYMTEGLPHYHYISKDGRRATDDSVLHDDGIYPINPIDMQFIAASTIAAHALAEAMRRLKLAEKALAWIPPTVWKHLPDMISRSMSCEMDFRDMEEEAMNALKVIRSEADI